MRLPGGYLADRGRPLGGAWEDLGMLLTNLGRRLGGVGMLLGGCVGRFLRGSWEVLGRSREVPGRLSGRPLGRFLVLLDGPWEALGGRQSILGKILGVLGRSLEVPGGFFVIP